MPVSSARLLANRRNALKSTGPKTAEGKSQSRRNSLKHGLTGDGVVLPAKDIPEVTRRFETLKAELQPSGEAGRIFLRRFAYLSVRLEKSEEFETSATLERVRHAVEAFDDHRMTEVEELAALLPNQPTTVARRLQATPEGIDWLDKHWGELLEDLRNPDRTAWTLNHWSRLEQLLGNPEGNFRMSRPYALTQALCGHFVYLARGDGEGLDDPSKIEWARGEMAAIIDGERARLAKVKAALDPRLIEQDRAEAPSRALFDPSTQASLARKYEAATERAMYKALEQFHEVELLALESEPVVISDIAVQPIDELGSFFQSSPREEEPDHEPGDPAPRSVYLPQPRSNAHQRPARKPTNRVPIAIGRPGNEAIQHS